MTTKNGWTANAAEEDITTLARGAITTLAGKPAGRLIHLLGQIVLARLFGPEIFGLYVIGWAFLRIIGTISPLGLQNGVIHFASKYWRKDNACLKGVLLQSMGLSLLSGVLIGIGFFFAAPWLAEGVFGKPSLSPVIRWFALAFPLMSGLRVAEAATRVSQRMKFSVYAWDIGQPMTNLILIFTFFFIGWRLIGAVVAGVASFGIAFILVLYYIKNLFPEIFGSRTAFAVPIQKLLNFSLPVAMTGLFTILILWVDRLLVGYFLPASEVGIYQVASQPAKLFAVILAAFNMIFTPMIARLYHKGEMERLNELFKISTKWGFYVSLPLFLVLIFVPKNIITVVFGASYESGTLPMVILATAQLINAGTGAVGFMLIMTGHQKRWFLLSAVMFFINFLLNSLLIPKIGIIGAALGTACAIGGLFLSGLIQVRHVLKLWPYDRRYFKGFLAVMSTVGLLLFLRSLDIATPLLILLLILSTSIVVFGSMLILLGLDDEDREFIGMIRMRLGNKNKPF